LKRVYVAGPMSNKNCIGYLGNVRRGVRASTELLLAGYAPFSPFLDYQFFLSLKEDEEITLEEIQAYSIAWLEASDAVLVLPNSENSIGVGHEVKRAHELGIPVYYNFEELDKSRFLD